MGVKWGMGREGRRKSVTGSDTGTVIRCSITVTQCTTTVTQCGDCQTEAAKCSSGRKTREG